MTRRVVAIVAIAAAAACVVAVGRIEGARGLRSQNRGMEALWRWASPSWSRRSFSAFRVAETFDCLLVARGVDPYAAEFCFDAEGRLVEAIDRRGARAMFWDITYQPSGAAIRVNPVTLALIFRRTGVDQIVGYKGDAMPIGYVDNGPQLMPIPGSVQDGSCVPTK